VAFSEKRNGSILVTGGNAGIGFALCKQLASENDYNVFLGCRSLERGAQAIEEIKKQAPAVEGKIKVVQLDVTDDASVSAAKAEIAKDLGEEKLYALVNNAGTGLAHNVDAQTIISTNYHGVKRVTAAFLPLVASRIVNVGSGAGPSFVNKCTSAAIKNILVSDDASIEAIEGCLTDGLPLDSMQGYGVSKACVAAYTNWMARQHPGLTISCCTPGFINTAIVQGFGATKTPEEGTRAIRHCLFEEVGGSGWYFGSDAVRSPLHFMRSPGEPEYDGAPPKF